MAPPIAIMLTWRALRSLLYPASPASAGDWAASVRDAAMAVSTASLLTGGTTLWCPGALRARVSVCASVRTTPDAAQTKAPPSPSDPLSRGGARHIAEHLTC